VTGGGQGGPCQRYIKRALGPLIKETLAQMAKERRVTEKEQRVWAYLIKNRKAPVEEVARECSVDEAFVTSLINRIGTPEETWRDGISNTVPAGGYPDDNPKTPYGERKPKISSTPVRAIREMGEVFELGAKKYGRYNWRIHQVAATVYYDAAWRHLTAWFEGEDIDPESGVSHLAHAMACMAILLDAGHEGNLTDNRLDAADKV